MLGLHLPKFLAEIGVAEDEALELIRRSQLSDNLSQDQLQEAFAVLRREYVNPDELSFLEINRAALAEELRDFKRRLPRVQEDLEKAVETLSGEIRQRRKQLERELDTGILSASFFSTEPSLDPDQTLLSFFSREDLSRDYGTLLRQHADQARGSERMKELLAESENLRQWTDESRGKFAEGDWEGCLGSAQRILDLVPEAPVAQELSLKCRQKLEEERDEEKEEPAEAALEPFGEQLAPHDPLQADSDDVRAPETGPRDRASAEPQPESAERASLQRAAPQQKLRQRRLIKLGAPALVFLIAAVVLLWKLTAPGPSPDIDYAAYQVQGGDSLEKLSSRLGIPARELIDINELRRPPLLVPGQVLHLTEPVAEAGTVILDIVPWASIESLVRTQDGTPVLNGQATTPLTLTLPAGEYTVTATNPVLGGDPMVLELEVQAGAQRLERLTWPGFELDSELDMVFGQQVNEGPR